MSKRVQIAQLPFRDICYIAANIRKEDWDECRCQMEDENKFTLANYCFFSTEDHLMWCAYLDGQPVTAFGVMKTGPTLGQIWMFSTRYVWRVFPDLLRFMDLQARSSVIAAGFRRVEIRAMATHEFVTKRWLDGIGAIYLEPLPQYGKNGEEFRLYGWWKGMPDERDVRSCYNRLRGSNPHVTSGYEHLSRKYPGGQTGAYLNGRSLPELDVH